MNSNTARKYNEINPNTLEHQYQVIMGNKRHRIVTTIRSGFFLATALMVLVGALTYYLFLQSDITAYNKEIARLEKSLNEIKLDNDENYSRITSNVDLDKIRTTAIQELGMKYADEGQIITFNGEGSDYVKQTGAIPSAK